MYLTNHKVPLEFIARLSIGVMLHLSARLSGWLNGKTGGHASFERHGIEKF